MPIQFLACFFFVQSFFGLQSGLERPRISEAVNVVPFIDAKGHTLEKNRTSAINIVFKSVDGGKTWQDVSTGLPEFMDLDCVFADSGKILLGTESGLYHINTTSAPPTWEKVESVDKGITEIFPGTPGPYACSGGNGFFQEIPATGVWVPMYKALVDKSVSTVLETQDGSLFVGCNTGIFKSTDHAKTWKQVFAEGRVMSLTATDGVLIGGGMRGVLRSTDNGEHWDWALTEDGAAFSTGVIEGGVAAITYDGGIKQLHISTDSGKTWQQEDATRPPVRFKRDIKQVGGYLFCSQDTGVFRSADQGKTWERVLPATSKNMFFDLAVSGKVVFAVALVGC